MPNSARYRPAHTHRRRRLGRQAPTPPGDGRARIRRVAQRRSSRADRHHLIAPRTAGTHSNITRETLPSMPHRRRSRSVRAREVPHVTRLPTVAGSALAVGIMQCAAWADLCGPILLRRRVIDRCYGVPSTGTVAACLTPTCVRDRAGSRQPRSPMGGLATRLLRCCRMGTDSQSRRTADLAGGVLDYLDTGPSDAPAVIVLDGYGSRLMGEIAAARADQDGIRVISPDRPGYWASSAAIR